MKQLKYNTQLMLSVLLVTGVTISSVFAQAQPKPNPSGKSPQQTQQQQTQTQQKKSQAQQTAGNSNAAVSVPAVKTVSANIPSKGREIIPEILAEVNGDKLSKKEIMLEAFRQHCEEVLDTKIKLILIDIACQQNNIVITREDETAFIESMARPFNLTADDLLQKIVEENGTDPEVYRSDTIRPLIAIRKLAGAKLEVSQNDIDKEFDKMYGPSVQVRQIQHSSLEELKKIRERVAANPESFASEAKNSSQDPGSRAFGGLIHPIFKNTTVEQIEKAVFSLQPGQISEIIDCRGIYFLFCCEQVNPPQNVDKEQIRTFLELKIRDAKTPQVAEEVFANLMATANVQNIINDKELSQKYPKLAAVVNGKEVTRAEIAEICMQRYGTTVLAERISIMLLEQECKKNNITLTEADVNAEIRDRASKEMPLLNDLPNEKGWLELQAKNLRVPVGAVVNNTIRPLVMLSKLAQAKVKITDEDIQKGFDANYGPRVRCLAIFCDNMRRAMQVWEMANKMPHQEAFADLAAKYSAHAPSRAMRGEIPPIGQYGGMPVLEKAAFSLQVGEISQAVQLGPEEYVILYCMGHTKPIVTSIDDVRDTIHDDIYEKKLRIEMQKYLEDLHVRSTVTNYLTGETRLAGAANATDVK